MADQLGLDPVERRVLGALLEKQRTVPDSYPLSLNGLRTACNQSTSRDPVVDYDDATLIEALGRLRDRELVRFVKITGIRVVKYHQRLEEHLELDPAQTAVLTVLLLRGAQSAGELRTRTERMHPFADRGDVEACLAILAELDPPAVRELPRQAGQHDPRWIHLLSGDQPATAETGSMIRTAGTADSERLLAGGAAARDRLVATEWDQLAEPYAAAFAGELADKPFDRWLLDRVAAQAGAAGATSGEEIQGLDVGCGPGQVTGYLAGRGVAMTGLDFSAGMLARARVDWPDLRFVHGSFTVPPMPRGGDPRRPGWAVITAWYALVHLAASELVPAVAALARVLRPGGLLAIALHVGPNGYRLEHPGELFDTPTELGFAMHDAGLVLEAAQSAGLVEIEWYRRGPIPQEVQTERLYLLARRN